MSRLVRSSRSLAGRAAAIAGLAFGALVVSTTTARAQDVLNFTGNAELRNADATGTNLFIDFLANGATDGPGGTVSALQTISGAFTSGISVGTVGDITDLTVSPSDVVGLPVNNFLTIGGYTFNLTGTFPAQPTGPFSFGPLAVYASGGGTSANFGVFGTVSGGSFSTARTFQGIFTAQFVNRTPAQVFGQVDSGGTLPVSFSATFTTGSVVPEPSTYVLLATGLGVLALVGLRRRANQL